MKYASTAQKNETKAQATALPISLKQSVEVCARIQGKSIIKALALLEQVIQKKNAIEFRRFNRGGLGHTAGKGPSRYPVKTCKAIVKLLRDAQANAEQKGINRESLVIRSVLAHKAAKSIHYGRKRRRQMKRTHLQVVVGEDLSKRQRPKKAKAHETKSNKVATTEPKEKPAIEKK